MHRFGMAIGHYHFNTVKRLLKHERYRLIVYVDGSSYQDSLVICPRSPDTWQ